MAKVDARGPPSGPLAALKSRKPRCRGMRSFPALASILALVLAGCSMPEEAPAPSSLTFTSDGSSISGPSQAEEGWTRIVFVNDGPGIDQAALYRLDADRGVEEFRAALALGEAPSWAVAAGGVAGAMPGARAVALVQLEPGTHVVGSFIPGADGVPGAAKGLLASFDVVGREGPLPREPTSDAEMTMVDFGYNASALGKGMHSVRVANEGSQPHEAVLVALAPGADVEAFLAAMGPGAEGPPPGAVVGGLAPIAPGGHGYIELELAEGGHAWICFVEDPASHAPHFALGMTDPFQA